jgi:hypothetical protein
MITELSIFFMIYKNDIKAFKKIMSKIEDINKLEKIYGCFWDKQQSYTIYGLQKHVDDIPLNIFTLPIDLVKVFADGFMMGIYFDYCRTLYGNVLIGNFDYIPWTILHLAAFFDRKEIIKLILKHKKPNPKIADCVGKTPLEIAKTFSLTDCIKILEDYIVDMDKVENNYLNFKNFCDLNFIYLNYATF